MTRKKYLVTGGAGFIGSHLVETLLAQGQEVVVLDNFLTGKRENLAAFQHIPGFELIEGDIRDFSVCQRAAAGCDAVFHEAALGSVPRSMADPQMTLEHNVQGFNNMIEAARRAEVRRFIYASSSSVYGDDPNMPKEEKNTGNALSPYAFSKQNNEAVADLYGRLFSMDTIGLRYFNVFGSRQDPAGVYAAVIPKFALQLKEHRSPVINGDGTFSRDFTYVDNVVEANLAASRAARGGFVCNVAAGGSTTLNELFAHLRREFAVFDPAIAEIEPFYGPERAGDIPHSQASIEKAERLLGYRPLITVAQGLKLTAKWYFENLK